MAVKNLKKFAKPLMRLMKRKALRQKPLAEIQENYSNASLEDMRNDQATQHANEDNLANEQLEQILYYELLRQQQQQQQQQQSERRQQHKQHYKENLTYFMEQKQQHREIHIPVHFARTSKGTFFWTSMLDVRTTTAAAATATALRTTTCLNDVISQNVISAAEADLTRMDRWGQA